MFAPPCAYHGRGGGRVRRIWDYAKLFGALGLVFLLLLWPAEALSAAQGAMRTWAGSVGPSLFPFLALLPMLTATAARRVYARALGWLMRPLFRLPGSAARPLLIGLLAGSPAGALAVERVSEGMPARRGAPAGADVCRGLAGLPRGRRGRGAVWLGGDGAVAGARAGGGAAVAGRCAARAL